MIIASRLLQTLDVLHTSFPRALTSSLPEFLAASLNHLQVLYPTFSHYYLSATEAVPSTSEDESIELPQLLCPIIDFLSAVTRGAKGREWLGGENILSVVVSMFNYVQMTDDDVCSSACNGVASFSHLCRYSLGSTTPTPSLRRKKMKHNRTVSEWLDLISSVYVTLFKSFSIYIYNRLLHQSLLERAPIQTTKSFQTTIEQVIHTSQEARGAGISDW